MKNTKNELLDFSKIKIEIEFINKNKYFLKYEQVKKYLIDNFQEIRIDNYKNIFMLKFYEMSDFKNLQDVDK